MYKKNLPRPRIQRAFVRWFNENRTRFSVPIRLTKITAEGVELHFPGYPDCLSVRLSRNGLSVHVNWQGVWWDMLIDLDAYLFHTPMGYTCSCCQYEEGESAPSFSNREALWLDHLFDPFMEWVNRRLAPAHWLKLSCTVDRGCTWAKLIRNEYALSAPDPMLPFLQQLKRLDGKPAYEGGPEGITNWILPLNPEPEQAAI